MDTGTGIALAGLSFSVVMLIYRILPPKNPVKDGMNGNGNGHCKDHSGVCTSIHNVEDWLKGISADVKELLIKSG